MGGSEDSESSAACVMSQELRPDAIVKGNSFESEKNEIYIIYYHVYVYSILSQL